MTAPEMTTSVMTALVLITSVVTAHPVVTKKKFKTELSRSDWS